MQGGVKENNENEGFNKMNYDNIKELLPHIEKFVLDLGNNLINLEDKFVFVEKNNLQLKNILNSEGLKFKKSKEIINDLKAENKFLK